MYTNRVAWRLPYTGLCAPRGPDVQYKAETRRLNDIAGGPIQAFELSKWRDEFSLIQRIAQSRNLTFGGGMEMERTPGKLSRTSHLNLKSSNINLSISLTEHDYCFHLIVGLYHDLPEAE